MLDFADIFLEIMYEKIIETTILKYKLAQLHLFKVLQDFVTAEL